MNGGIRRSFVACENLNHRRTNASVAYCPACGALVNPQRATSAAACTPAQHDHSRRQQNQHCVDCGKQLIAPR